MQNGRSYRSYFVRSKGRHGVHSPFVFQLADTCLTAKVDKNFKTERKKWFRQLTHDRHLFSIVDLGAGSKKLTQQRSVSKLLKSSSSRGVYGDVLYQLARFYRPETVLELGTSLGVGTIHLKKGHPSAHIITVEGCSETQRRALQSLDHWNLDGVTTICAPFDEFLQLPASIRYDLVFIDGNHDGKATLYYLESLLKQVHNETLFIFDDIRWSDDMWQAWQQIVSDERFHVTIDLGRMGLVWQRTQQTKEHFTLRPKIWKTKWF